MSARFGHVVLIFALLGATGAHWALLQSVAWATMLADNSRTEDLGTAIVNTFDGKHPCALCKQISKGRQNEKKSDIQINLKRLEFCHKSVALDVSAPRHFLTPQSVPVRMTSLAKAPPVPPPRFLLG